MIWLYDVWDNLIHALAIRHWKAPTGHEPGSRLGNYSNTLPLSKHNREGANVPLRKVGEWPTPDLPTVVEIYVKNTMNTALLRQSTVTEGGTCKFSHAGSQPAVIASRFLRKSSFKPIGWSSLQRQVNGLLHRRKVIAWIIDLTANRDDLQRRNRGTIHQWDHVLART